MALFFKSVSISSIEISICQVSLWEDHRRYYKDDEEHSRTRLPPAVPQQIHTVSPVCLQWRKCDTTYSLIKNYFNFVDYIKISTHDT